MNEAIRMQLSAFADGELPDNEKELLLRRLSQDAVMRRQVAEYLAIGRAMRGEVVVQGLDSLRDRINEAIGAIGDEQAGASEASSEPQETRIARPLAGMAIAATVALAAIFGLRQMIDVPETVPDTAAIIDADTSFPTQPDADKVLEQYRLLHDAEASGNSLRKRFTAIEVRQGIDAGDLTEADPGRLPAATDVEERDATDDEPVDGSSEPASE